MLDNRKSFLVARISAQVSSGEISGHFFLGTCCSQHSPTPSAHGVGSSGRVSQTLHSISAVKQQYGVLLLLQAVSTAASSSKETARYSRGN